MTDQAKPKRFANPSPLNPDTRVLKKIVPGGVTVRQWDQQLEGFVEQVRRKMEGAADNSSSPRSPSKS